MCGRPSHSDSTTPSLTACKDPKILGNNRKSALCWDLISIHGPVRPGWLCTWWGRLANCPASALLQAQQVSPVHRHPAPQQGIWRINSSSYVCHLYFPNMSWIPLLATTSLPYSTSSPLSCCNILQTSWLTSSLCPLGSVLNTVAAILKS